jgi:uncharacterized phage protein gp47/JayE
MSADTIDMQVSVRGGGWLSDPDLIVFEETTFTIPNPAAYPDGLQLFPGNNILQVKSVLTSGAVTNYASTNAILSLEKDINNSILAPTGIYVERYDQTVKIIIDGIDSPYVVGYNFYASIASGGGTTGYSQINPQTIITGNTTEVFTTLGNMTVNANIVKLPDGSPVSTPYYVKIRQDQVDNIGTIYQTDCNQLLEIPQTTTRIQSNFNIEAVSQTTQYSFIHDRRSVYNSSINPAIPNSDFTAIPTTDPLYYVVTAIYLIDNQEYESAFSPEVAASPLVVTPAIRNIPVVNRDQISKDFSLAIYRSHPEIDIKPGSVIRDTVVDPFSTEAERIRFLISFMQAAQSFATLLPIDDPGYTGISIPVSQSPYKIALKQALFLKTDNDVQNLIDNIFDQLAAQRGIVRETGTRARGEVTAYMTTRPVSPRFIALGTVVTGGGMTFRTTSSATITSSGSSTIYNPITGRYAVILYIQAETNGTSGNLTIGQIQNIIDGPPGVQVINEAPTFGGTDIESNLALATRADGVLSSVDTGTHRGYLQKTIEVAGVQQAFVVDSGDPLMQRDYDPATGKHTGGKVDIWIRGENTATLSDVFAFSFEIVQNGQFEPTGLASSLTFRAINANITNDNPIIEMLNYPSWGWEFVDNTTGHIFDLTGVTILPPDMIKLDATLPANDPAQIHLTDSYTGSYRFRTSNKYVLPSQPANNIISLSGDPTRSGTIPSTLYKLYQGSLPLELGRSIDAANYVQITQPIGSTTTIPSGLPIEVIGESHVFLFSTEYLDYLGINPLTVRVYNNNRTIEYNSPYVPDKEPDFTFIDEHENTPLGLRLTSETRIVEGEALLVDYSHDENFVVDYEMNSIVPIAQSVIDETKHITADVLVKEGIQVGVNLTATIAIYGNYNVPTVDSYVRTNLSRLFSSLVLGQPVRQSDIIETIDASQGVSYVVVPLTQMSISDGVLIPQEVITTDQTSDFVEITKPEEVLNRWHSNTVDIFLLDNPLSCGTLNGGGNVNDPCGVFYNENLFYNYFTSPNVFSGVPMINTPNSAFIIGNTGMYIPGYSDDETIINTYHLVTEKEILAKRIEITARRILVALPKGTTPLDATWWVSYVVYGDTGVKNIEPGPLGYVTLGNLEFTYASDTETTIPRNI